MSAKHSYSIPSALKISALTAVSCVLLAGCSGFSKTSTSSLNPVRWITPYKVDVIQGNFLSKEQVEAVKPGMTRDQVKQVLGTPLLASVFHEDRWDYVFTLKRQGVEPQTFKYTVYFKGDQLERAEGDTMPSEAEFIAKLDSGRKIGKAPPLEATEAQMNKAADKSPVKSTAAAPAPATGTAPAVYPPLESPKR